MADHDREDDGFPERIRDQLANYLRSGQENLLPDKLIKPQDGLTESTADVSLMRKVAMSFCDLTHTVPDPTSKSGVRPASTHERLQRAGVSPAMYAQMVQHPEFPRILNRTSIEFVVLPRLPQIQASLAGKAEKGDDRAARVLFELSRLTELPTMDDMRREYATLDEDGWRKRIREETEGALKLLDEMEGKVAMNETTT